MKAKTYFFCVLFTFLFSIPYLSQTDIPDSDMWITNGSVYTITTNDDYAYVGGEFTYVGSNSGCGAKLKTVDDENDVTFPKVNGTIYAVAPDGSGGWFIGGAFKKVGSYDRNYLAHINYNGTVDADWNPSPNSWIYSIAVDGNDIYVGGAFSTIGDKSRNRIAKLNKTDGVVDDTWSSDADNTITTIAIDNTSNYIYVGGNFNNIKGVSRYKIAKLSKTDGAVDATWNPTVSASSGSSYISTIAIDATGNYIYIGGQFTYIKGQGRNNIAKLNNTDGTPDATWDPSANSNVNTIVIDGTGNYIYTGGSFTTIGGQTRNRIAKLNNTNGNADVTWDPNSDVTVKTIAISGSDIFVGGFFNSIGGLTRNYIAKLNSVNGAAFSDWDPNPMDDVLIISIDGAGVYVGGTFPSINCVKRNFIARFHNSNGKVDNDWDPNSNGAVSTIAISGDDVYVGGIFTEIAGVSRNRIAKLNNIDGDADVTFNPNANNQVINIIFDKTGDTLFVGGSFTLIGTLSRNYIAKLNTTNGNAIATFNPNAGLYVYTIKLDNSGDTLFVGGNFTTIGGQSRNRIAKLNTTNGSADLSWNPNSDGPIYSIEITSNSNDVFAGGIFTSIGGQSRNNIAKLNNTNGDANLSWDANSDEMIARIKIIGNDIFVGGNFTTIGGQSRNYIARLNNTNGDADLSWNPNANGLVTSIESYKNSIYIGGEFIRIGGEPQWYLAKFKNALAIELNLKIFLQGAYR